MSMSEAVRNADFDKAIADFDVTNEQWSTHHHEMQHYMRGTCPVLHSAQQGGYYVLTKHADMVEVLRDWETYSNTGGVFLSPLPGNQGLMPTDLDPPIQRDFRRLIDKYLAPAQIKPLEDKVRATANELVDTFIERGECDLYQEFARLLPSRAVLVHLLGATPEQEAAANHWVEKAMSSESVDDVVDGFGGLVQWVKDMLEERRNAPRRDDIIDQLLHGRVQKREVTYDEQVSALMSVTIGGLETGSSVISAGMVNLIENPDVQDRLRRDPSLLTAAVDEMARLGSPTSLARTVTRETVLDGQRLVPGDRVLIVFGAGNRDGEAFHNPDQFDIDRGDEMKANLAFGAGMHRCPGINYAKMIIRTGFAVLLERLGDIRLEEPVEWTATQFRSPREVHISFEELS